MDGKGDSVLVELPGQADFDSHGEFQVDWLRAREKLEVHLGLWPEDYLCFLAQAAYALGARKLRLSASWNSLYWEFDGQAVSPEQLATLFPLDRSAAGSEPLARLQMAFFLLTRSRYARWTFRCGLGEQAASVSWSSRGHRFRQERRSSGWAHRLEVHLTASQINLRWLLTRRSALWTLPEYAALKQRLVGSPLQVEVPWKTEYWNGEEELFAVRLVGACPSPEQPPVPAATIFEVPSRGEFSGWFVSGAQNGTICVLYGLGYEGPQQFRGGRLWLYQNHLRTDLAHKQLVHGPGLEKLLQAADEQLGQALIQDVFPRLGEEARTWFLAGLTELVENGRGFGGLYELPLFRTVAHGKMSLLALDDLTRDDPAGALYITAHPEVLELPPGAPPIVVLEPEVASLLRKRYPGLADCAALLAALQQREEQKRLWSARAEEPLTVREASFRAPVPCAGWEGEVALCSAAAPARLHVFLQGRWLASVPLPARFPLGYVGRVQHPELRVNAAWTEPDTKSSQWGELIASLWAHLPLWLAELLATPDSPAWLRSRAGELLLQHEAGSPLEKASLFEIGDEWLSLVDLRLALQEGRLHRWVWRGWNPSALSWRLLSRLAGDGDVYRWWRTRLEQYYQEYRRWCGAAPGEVKLPRLSDAIGTLPLAEGRGQLAMLPLPAAGVQLFAYRGRRLLTQQNLAGLPYTLNGLPDGLQVAVNHDEFVPDLESGQIPTLGEVWTEVQGWIRERLPDLVEAVLLSRYQRRDLLALRLLAWLPRDRWPSWDPGPDLVRRLDGEPVRLAVAISALDQGPPVRVLVEPGEQCCPLPDFMDVWLVSRELRAELAAVWGPSRIEDCQEAYLTAWMVHEQGQSTPLEPVLPEAEWLARGPIDLGDGVVGEVGVRSAIGRPNGCKLQVLRRGFSLCEGWVALGEEPALASDFALEAVLEVGQSELLPSFQAWKESATGRQVLTRWVERMRMVAFESPWLELECLNGYRWERLACEAGARETLNSGFTVQLDDVRRRLIEVPLFRLESRLWTLAEVLSYLLEKGRLGYVLGDPIQVAAGPILYVNARELNWIKLLFGNTRLANLSHLRGALQEQKKRSGAPPVARLEIPELDYVLTGEGPRWRWGLQREFNGASTVQVLHHMRPVESLRFNWVYQLLVCLNVDELERNQDGTLRRDQGLQRQLDELRAEVQQAIVQRAPARYRLELSLWFWGSQQEWARVLQEQPLLRDPRGQDVSVRGWVSAWEDDSPLPYLREGDHPDEPSLWELLPDRPVPLLAPELLPAAGAWLAGLHPYQDGLRVAWRLWHEQSPWIPPAGATYQWAEGSTRLWADLVWTNQKVCFTWRGRLLHSLSRPGWPGYEMELDCSGKLLGVPLPGWPDVEGYAAPYRRYLHNLLKNPDLLDETRELWQNLPVPPTLELVLVTSELTDADLRMELGRLKAQWQIQQRDRFAPLQRACALWCGEPVEIRVDPDMPAPAREERAPDGQCRLLWFNPEHRWFRGQSLEVVALRLTAWLQRSTACDWPQSAALRVQLLQQLGLLQDPPVRQEEG